MRETNMLVEPVGLVRFDPNPKGTVLIGSGAERVRRRKRLLGKALLQVRPRNAEKSYESAKRVATRDSYKSRYCFPVKSLFPQPDLKI